MSNTTHTKMNILQNQVCRWYKLTMFRELISPRYVTMFISGAHWENSRCQDVIVERGTTTRNGPYNWWWWNK